MSNLSSRNNPRIKQLRALRQRKERQASGLFLVEGIRHLGEAFDAGAAIETVCYAPDLLDSAYAHDLLRRLQTRGVDCLVVAADTLASLAEKDNPQGILAAVRQPQRRLSDLTPANFSWGAALVAPQDPGNIGTVLRTLDAVGASGLLLLDNAADPYQPGAVRASMGALFWQPLVQASFTEFLAWARQGGYHLYGTSAHGREDYRQGVRYQRPCILLLGSERQGLSAEQSAACELLLRLPMRGKSTSLNLAVAAGVMLYAMLEQLA